MRSIRRQVYDSLPADNRFNIYTDYMFNHNDADFATQDEYIDTVVRHPYVYDNMYGYVRYI